MFMKPYLYFKTAEMSTALIPSESSFSIFQIGCFNSLAATPLSLRTAQDPPRPVVD